MAFEVAVIDDDPAVRDLIAEVMRDAGHRVRTYDRLDDLPPSWEGDAVVMDTIVEPYDAEVVAAHVRSVRLWSQAAVVLVSAHRELLTDQPQIVPDAVVMKPFDIDELTAAVETAVVAARESRASLLSPS